MTAGPEAAPVVAIVCGGGGFPLAVARAAQASGRRVVMLALRGVADPGVEMFPHEWVKLGEVGRFFRILAEREAKELCLVGAFTRPELSELSLDFGAIKRLPDIARMLRGGDDHGLRALAAFFEGEGYALRGVHEIAPDLLTPAGVLGRRKPSAAALDDARWGLACCAALSPFDVGQAAVVVNGRIVAVEAAEGTDAMLERVARLRAQGRLRLKGAAGVLVKAPKRGQDLRLDLPAAGVDTIQRAAAAGLEGVALAAGQTLTLDRDIMIARADAAGLFLMGMEEEVAEGAGASA
jgi:DUF1009 family protein